MKKWKAVFDIESVCTADEKEVIANVYGNSADETRANCQLIACAPEMLSWLKTFSHTPSVMKLMSEEDQLDLKYLIKRAGGSE